MKKTFALMAAGADLGSVTSIATLDINHLLSTEHKAAPQSTLEGALRRLLRAVF